MSEYYPNIERTWVTNLWFDVFQRNPLSDIRWIGKKSLITNLEKGVGEVDRDGLEFSMFSGVVKGEFKYRGLYRVDDFGFLDLRIQFHTEDPYYQDIYDAIYDVVEGY